MDSSDVNPNDKVDYFKQASGSKQLEAEALQQPHHRRHVDVLLPSV